MRQGQTVEFWQRKDRGAALLIVLVMVATLATISVGIVQTVINARRIAGYNDARGQANWYVQAAEELARVRLGQLAELNETGINRYVPGLGTELSFPIDGGLIKAQIDDASNCFNLNSLAGASSDGDEASAATQTVDSYTFYVELLKAMGIGPNEAERLASTAADWVDVDSDLRAFGAEAGLYASALKPRSVANTRMISDRELLDVSGYTPEIYRQIAPFVCARPDTKVGAFNINTMDERHAPLMAAIFTGQIATDVMIGVMEQQGEIVHENVEAFLEHPTLAQVAPEFRSTSLLGTDSKYFRLTGEVVYLDSVTSYEAVLEVEDGGDAKLVRRRLGADE